MRVGAGAGAGLRRCLVVPAGQQVTTVWGRQRTLLLLLLLELCSLPLQFCLFLDELLSLLFHRSQLRLELISRSDSQSLRSELRHVVLHGQAQHTANLRQRR